MALAAARTRVARAALTGRYDLFLGVGAGLAILGAILTARALLGEHDLAERAWHVWHVNWVYFTGLAGAHVAFTAVHKIVNAKWSGLVIRFTQATLYFLPVVLVTFLVTWVFGYEAIWGHMHEELHGLSPGKAWWLSKPVMFTRVFGFLCLLYLVGWRLVRADLLPDVHELKGQATGSRKALFEKFTAGWGSPETMARTQRTIYRLAPVYVVLYAITYTFVAFDTMMALQPHWFSNLFGGWYFMASFLSAHMSLALLMIYGGRQLGIADLISAKQRHDLGKLCFGFSVFWAYLMWAQFQVIWYANMPEETGFVYSRVYGDWWVLSRVVLVGMFVVPFFGLLGVAPKKNRFTLGLFAGVSLVALWLCWYLMVMPSVSKSAGPVFGLPELGPTLLFPGLFLACYALFARRWPMVSPRLAEITLEREIHHHEVETFDHEDDDRDFVHERDLSPGRGPA